MKSTGVLICLVAPVFLSGQAQAQEKPGAARTVLLLDKLCYEMLPDLASLEKRAAKLKWTAITGSALKAFSPPVPPKVLKAWAFKDLGISFRIAVTQSALDEQSKKDFPEFAKAESYSCSLIIPAKSPRAEISAAMQKLMSRKPDESFDQGRMKIDTWGGKNEKHRVIINHMGAKNGAPGGLLGITLMVK